MKQIIITFLITFIFFTVYSQTVETYKYSGSGSAAVLEKYKTKTIETKGVYFYNEEWQYADIIMFSGDKLENFPVRYNLGKNILEIKSDDIVKVISIGQIKEIHFHDKHKNETLKNTVLYKNNEGVGFFTVLSEGDKVLLKKTYLEVIEPNYVNALDVGEQERKIVQRAKYYTANKDNEVTQIKKNKRYVLKLLNDKAEDIKKYISQNKLSVKNENDLIKIFNYYNII